MESTLQHSIFSTRLGSALAAFFLACACAAQAATFSVDPISVSLQKSNASTSIAITNQSAQRLRLQITGFNWGQRPDGEMNLTPAPDLIFFPQLLTLDPGETRRVRVGVTAAQGAQERTFRLFMEELPSLESVVSPAKNGVTIRMKVGIPIFIAPAAPAAPSGTVRDVRVSGGTLAFDVANTGNVHFSLQRVHVSAKTQNGDDVLSRDLTGWYVLAGGTRHYTVEFSKARCSSVHSITVDVRAGSLSFSKSFDDPDKRCGAASAH